MNILRFIFTVSTIAFLSFSSIAQDSTATTTPSLESGTIQEQFEYIVKKSNKYQDYKVVKQAWINRLKGNVSDSIHVLKNALSKSNHTIGSQQSTIDTLNVNLSKLNDNLAYVNKEKDSVVFLGMLMEKSAYKGLMWSIVGILFVLLSLFIYKFKRANVLTSEAQTRLEEIQDEFESFRKNSREKEQKLKRELQDEINKGL